MASEEPLLEQQLEGGLHSFGKHPRLSTDDSHHDLESGAVDDRGLPRSYSTIDDLHQRLEAVSGQSSLEKWRAEREMKSEAFVVDSLLDHLVKVKDGLLSSGDIGDTLRRVSRLQSTLATYAEKLPWDVAKAFDQMLHSVEGLQPVPSDAVVEECLRELEFEVVKATPIPGSDYTCHRYYKALEQAPGSDPVLCPENTALVKQFAHNRAWQVHEKYAHQYPVLEWFLVNVSNAFNRETRVARYWFHSEAKNVMPDDRPMWFGLAFMAQHMGTRGYADGNFVNIGTRMTKFCNSLADVRMPMFVLRLTLLKAELSQQLTDVDNIKNKIIATCVTVGASAGSALFSHIMGKSS